MFFLFFRAILTVGSVIQMMQSSGYGIPQTYLNTYAHDDGHGGGFSQTESTLLLTLFNIPGILSSSFFGHLGEEKPAQSWSSLSAATVTGVSSLGSAASVFLLWGLASRRSMAALVCFSLTFRFFSSGYSATWAGVIRQMEVEASARDRGETVDVGMLYGLLNGARGLGYVSGGLVGVPLLKTGSSKTGGGGGSTAGYATEYGSLIIFTGLSLVLGGWSIVWNGATGLSKRSSCVSSHLSSS
jgi:hypothetical protein